MKRSKIVEIKIDAQTSKSFTVNELSVEDIIVLGQNNEFFSGKKENKEDTEKNVGDIEAQGFMKELQGTSKSIQEVIAKTCDFKMEDLKKLAPSDVQEIFDEWKEVNTTFLSFLEKMGILEAGKLVIQKAMSEFLKTLAI